jgi:hypothetical protein
MIAILRPFDAALIFSRRRTGAVDNRIGSKQSACARSRTATHRFRSRPEATDRAVDARRQGGTDDAGGESQCHLPHYERYELEANALILTLAIRDKATCEIRIPKGRYHGLVLLELIEQESRRNDYREHYEA